MKRAVAAAIAACVLAPAANAATVVGATSVTITNAIPDYLQIAEVLAFDFNGVNVALAANGATATALSQFFDHTAPQGGPAETIDGFYPASYDYAFDPAIPGVYHSGGSGGNEFLTVTFAAPTTLASVTVYGRGECCQTRDIFNVTIRNGGGSVLYSGQLDARASPPGSATVTFDQPTVTQTPVPEPAAWALMIIGFGGAGALLRRRSAVAAG